MENVLVSIALCTYNGEKYLKEQLDSILSQTYSAIELIIVDDHSNDSTPLLLNSYREKYPNIHLYFNEINLGFNKNFEKAISYSKGEFICISDQDDIWREDKIEQLINNIGDNWVIFSNSEFLTSDGRHTGTKLLNNFQLQNNYQIILFENFITGHTAMLRKNVVDYIFPIPDNGFYDWWIGFVALYHNKLAYLDQNLTLYRIHNNSVIQQALSDRTKKIGTRNNLATQLGIFSKYKNLKLADRKFIENLMRNVDTIKNPIFNPLLPFLLKNFSYYFPKRGNKTIFSKLNFLRKFLRIY